MVLHNRPLSIFVVYLNQEIVNISIRGKGNMIKLTAGAIKGIEGASGGGHEHATGAKLNASDLSLFKERVEKFV